MSSTNPILNKDGASQDRRMLPMLDPGYAPVDERKTEDFLRFARDFAQKVRFHQAEGGATGTWEGFLAELSDPSLTLTPAQRERERDKWLKQILRYLDAPDQFQGTAEQLARLSQPHLALFLTFLKLLAHIQTQLNSTGHRHLEHYYRKTLSLTRREALPDLVHAVLTLTEGVDAQILPAGTLFSAGTDSAGKDILYRADEETLLSKTSVAALRTVFVEKERTTTEDFHRLHAASPTQGFEEMWRIPLGESEPGKTSPGSKLPDFLDGRIAVPFSETLFTQFYNEQNDARTESGIAPDDLIWLDSLTDPVSNQDWARVRKLMQASTSQPDIVTWLNTVLHRPTFAAEFRVVMDNKGLSARIPKMQRSSAYLRMSQADIHLIGSIRKAEKEAIILDVPGPKWTSAYPLLEAAYRVRRIEERQRDIAAHRADPAVLNKTTDQGFTESLAFATGRYKHPDGYRMPPFRGLTDAAIVEHLRVQLSAATSAPDEETYNYILKDLHIQPLDFAAILTERQKALDGNEANWDLIDQKLELAQRTRDELALEAPVLEEWRNIYTYADATLNLSKPELGIEENDPRWKTFGAPQRNPNEAALRAPLGFAIASDLLSLSEGDRRITLTLSCDSTNFPQQALQTFLDESKPTEPFFDFYLSSAQEWVRPRVESITLGTYLPDMAGVDVSALYEADEPLLQLRAINGTLITQDNKGDLIAFPSGAVYQIDAIPDPQTAVLVVTPTLLSNPPATIRRILPSELLSHSIRIALTLSVQDPAIGAPGEELPNAEMAKGKPLLRILLADLPYQSIDTNETRLKKAFQVFERIKIQRFHIHTRVQGLQSSILENDSELIDPGKPFAPFTDYPRHRSTFYFTHQELASKRIDQLSFQLNWDQVPSDLADYYSPYDKIAQADPELDPSEYAIQENDDFQAQLFLVDRRVKVPLGQIPLFDRNDAQAPKEVEISDLISTLHTGNPNYQYRPLALPEEPAEEAIRWPRYFQMVMGELDFRDDEYQELAIRQAQIIVYDDQDPIEKERNTALKLLELKPPLSPKLRDFRLAYTASELTTLGSSSPSVLYHLHPFGYTDVLSAGTSLLPAYTDEGHLYIGLADAEPGAVIPILFQMAEGSANPDLPKSPVNWYFLHGDTWVSFGDADIVRDDTKGLLKSGLIRLKVPALADTQHQLLPSELTWLRASVASHTDSVSDVIRIVAQAVRATFVDQENAEDHLFGPLKPNSIASTVEPILGISEISQPFPSTGGRPRESDSAFYTRISERLRHKRRAITMWDYERLVLEAFPDVHKVKCLSSNYDRPSEAPGTVTMIVIPDIIGRFPFNPYQPKVPAEKLVEIKDYLQRYMSPFAQLSVKNPRYLQVEVRVAVKLRPGYSEGYYKAQLEDDLRRYLAPWAYKEGRDIVFGGKLFANVIVDYIERRPYIDYIGRINLFQSEDGKNFRDARLFNRGENMVKADEPDIVLVSAVRHQIEIIKEGEFQEILPEGIGHARIEVDFYVSETFDTEL